MKLQVAAVLIFLLAACSSSKNTGPSAASEMVEDQQFTFVARSVFPTEDARYSPRVMFPNGSNIYQLTSRYDVRITPDSVIAYLPFFGRAYTAPLDPSKGGIQFTSTDFSYKTSRRKGNYEIEIQPHDYNEVRSLYFSISSSGYASLRVLNLNKTPISYNGEIEPHK